MELDNIERFITDLGFRMVRENQQRTGLFVPGVYMDGMTVYVSLSELVSPGDIYHEVGHVAIIPAMFRPHVKGDVEKSLEHLTKDYLDTHPINIDDNGTEDMVCRGLLQASESEAQAWSYAAAIASGIPPESVFHKNAYDGEGDNSIIMLSHANHRGVHGLQAAKMTTKRTFPTMIRWLQV